MKIEIWSIGKAHDKMVIEGVEEYTKRLSKYTDIKWRLFNVNYTQHTSIEKIKLDEAALIQKNIDEDCFVIMLDEAGKLFNTMALAKQMQQIKDNSRVKKIIFLIGGAYGIHPNLLAKAHIKMSLSMLTFPHQLVRLILIEQIYRCFTILNNQSYHH